MKNLIYLRRKNKVIVKNGMNVLAENVLSTALKNLESYGFTCSKDLQVSLRTLSSEDFVSFYKQLIKDVKKMVGSHVTHEPMYPNFPDEVMDMEESQLYINAVQHYLSSFVRDTVGAAISNEGKLEIEKEERFPLLENVKLTVIDLGTEEEFNEIIQNLIGSNTSISQTDKEDVKWAIASYEKMELILPEEIPMKEQIAFVVSELLENKKAKVEEVKKYFKTATDVLRLAVSLSGGDVSLAEKTHFKKFTRSERRFLLGLIEGAKNQTEDMLRYKVRWIRLAEILHPGEYKKRFPKANQAFHILRNNEPFQTFNSKVETSLEKKDVLSATKLLMKRPGEFARRLDHLLRFTEHSDVVLLRFKSVVKEVSTPVLLQLMSHFKHRSEENDLRVIFPKGDIANVTAIENKLETIEEEVCRDVVEVCEEALIERFRTLEPLGKVQLDKELENFIVPFNQRSASKSLRTIVRGSNIDLPEGDTVRFFLWWKEGGMGNQYTGRVDIDLSSIMYDKNWEYKEHVSYTNLRSRDYKAAHSGDITSAPNGACEFIDIDIPSIVNHGGRYIVMNLYSFTGQKFSELPECFCGWMMRQEPGSGEVFEPKTVQDKLDVTANARIAVPVILDLVERKVIWCDIALNRDLNYGNNVENNKGTVTLMGKAMTSLVKPNLYDLFSLHAKARGQMVTELPEGEEYDTIFSINEGITPFDIEKIMSDFLV